MKKLLPIAIFFIATATLTLGNASVFAQDKPAAVSSAPAADSAMSKKDFDERKTKILKHIGERLTKMQEIQSCVQAAQDSKALEACRSHKEREEQREHHHHD